MAHQRGVRFASPSQNDYHTYPVMTPTPSPSFSISTIDSGDGPSTPPSFPFLEIHPNSPASYTFVQPGDIPSRVFKEPVQLDKVFTPQPYANTRLELWRDRPAFKQLLASSHIPPQVLDAPATTPPVNQMEIVSEYLPQDKPIRIHTSAPADPNSFVSVRDVFLVLHHELHKGISPQVYKGLQPPLKEAVKQAYLRRCRNASGGPAMVQREYDDGVKLVDLLCNRQLFAGLLASPSLSNVWILVVDKLALV